MDIYYYYNSLAEEKSLGVLSVGSESIAKVLPFGPRGTGSAALGIDSKQWVENCPLDEMVIQGHHYPNATNLLNLLTSLSQKSLTFPRILSKSTKKVFQPKKSELSMDVQNKKFLLH